MANDPNGLELNERKRLGLLGVVKMAKWPLYVAGIGAVILFSVMFYSVNYAHNQEREAAKTPTVDILEHEQPLLMGEGKGLGLATLPPPNIPAIAQPEPQSPPESALPIEPLIVVRTAEPEAPQQYLQELENIRRMRVDAYISALSSPMGAERNEVQTAAAQASAGMGDSSAMQASYAGLDSASLRENGYDPAADIDKEGFLDRASANSWILGDTRTLGHEFEIKTGTVIPGVMITGINSDLPGQIIAQVSQSVRDTATGRHILIPQGSRLFGTYDSRVVYGQERVLVAWQRLIFPDGSSISLEAMPGSDLAGYSGYTDKVDNHYLRIFGSAVLMSLISGGTGFAMDSFSDSGSSENPSIQDQMGTALATQLGQTTLSLLERNLSIKPTLQIRPGYQFNLVVTKDIVFQAPYQPLR